MVAVGFDQEYLGALGDILGILRNTYGKYFIFGDAQTSQALPEDFLEGIVRSAS